MLTRSPHVADPQSIAVLDLLGTGSACLVRSSPLPSATCRSIRFLALMDEKPHLLVGVRNNLGAETRITYAPPASSMTAGQSANGSVRPILLKNSLSKFPVTRS